MTPPFSRMRLLALDVDGVLTDGGLYYGSEGVLQKFNSRDGGELVRLRRSGFPVALVSFRDLPATRRRAADLGINLLCLGTSDKAEALSGLCRYLSIEPSETIFMGDNLMDLEAVRMAGIGACPSDAHPDIISSCEVVTSSRGGEGAVFELIRMMKDGGAW